MRNVTENDYSYSVQLCVLCEQTATRRLTHHTHTAKSPAPSFAWSAHPRAPTGPLPLWIPYRANKHSWAMPAPSPSDLPERANGGLFGRLGESSGG